MLTSGIEIHDKEDVITFKDGSRAWASNSRIPLKNEAGEVIGLLVVTKDITEIKNIHFELVNKKKMLEQISATHPVIFYTLDNTGKILSIESSILEKIGINQKAAIGVDFTEIFPSAGNFIDIDLGDNGYSFVHKNKNVEISHFIFANDPIKGGFCGMALVKGLKEQSAE
ncbi:MAG: PAS domain-containing protein [Bacteroidales bacterium]|nr:PAS domain-containing protein [Bacteroidales bacterium]